MGTPKKVPLILESPHVVHPDLQIAWICISLSSGSSYVCSFFFYTCRGEGRPLQQSFRCQKGFTKSLFPGLPVACICQRLHAEISRKGRIVAGVPTALLLL